MKRAKKALPHLAEAPHIVHGFFLAPTCKYAAKAFLSLAQLANSQRVTVCAVTARKGSPKKAAAVQNFAGCVRKTLRGIA
jgi:hypothetical protein